MPTPTKRTKQPVGAMDEATEYLRYLAILVGVYLIQTAIWRQGANHVAVIIYLGLDRFLGVLLR